MSDFVLGITSKPVRRALPIEPGFFGKWLTPDIKGIIKAADRNGIRTIVYHYDDIDWKNERVRGYYWDTRTNSWKQTTATIPHATINRTTGVFPARLLEKHSRYSTSMNPRELPKITANKLRTAEVLISQGLKHPQTFAYDELVPPHNGMRNTRGINELIREHACIYVKPNFGSFGYGVIRIEKSDGNKARLIYKISNEDPPVKEEVPLSKIHNSIKRVLERISKESGVRVGDPSSLVVQPAVNVKPHSGKPWSVRYIVSAVFTKKPPSFEVTARGVNVGMRGSYGSNHNAVSASLGSILADLYGIKEVQALARAGGKLAVEAVSAIQKKIGESEARKRIGQAAVEVVFDKDGVPWVVEVNSAPRYGILSSTERAKCYDKLVELAVQKARLVGTCPESRVKH